MKTEKGEVVRVQGGRRVILPLAFCKRKVIKEDDLVLIECVKKVEIEIKERSDNKNGKGNIN